jgi:formylglycine-generating enzyme required for sulfatase activity
MMGAVVKRRCCWGLLSVLFVISSYAAELSQPFMALYSTTNATQSEVAWSTQPGIRYVLQECTNLDSNNWVTVAGYPSEADALAQQHVTELDHAGRFFRVQVLDEQPPEIEESYPAEGDFGVGRFSSISIELADATGIDENSIGLTLGTNEIFTLSSSEISWSNNVLTLDLGGDTALGGYGVTQTVALAVADTLGNTTNYVWSFELEVEIDAATNLFVFGSPDAQRSGQRLSGLSAAVAARFGGPVRMSAAASEWEFHTVTSNEVVLSYTTNAPAFEVDQLLANLAPAHESEIFYRRVLSLSDNTASNLLTLRTEDVLIGEIMENGSFTLGVEDAVFLEFDTNGTLVAATDVNETIDLPVMGADFSGTSLWSDGSLDLSLSEACFTLSPKLKVSLETEDMVVERFEAKLSGDLNIACVPQLTLSDSYSKSVEKELWSKSYWYWAWAGYVPVGVELDASVTAKAEIAIEAEATLSAGFRQTGELWAGGSYVRTESPTTEMDRGFALDPFEVVPFTYTLDGSAGASVWLVPQIDCLLYGAAGIYVNTDPHLSISGSASFVNNELTEAAWLLGAYADVNVGLSLIGDLDEDLPSLSFNIFTKEWGDSYEAETAALEILTQPISQSAAYGDSVTLSVQADGGSGSYSYEWLQDGKELPGETAALLALSLVDDGYEGDYTVQITSGSETVVSDAATLNVVTSGGTGITSGMVKIPGGTNSGTNPLGDGESYYSYYLETYSLTVDTFYMDRTEVTKAQWDTVYSWAVANGYSFDNAGSGKGSSHPVHTVNWYDCVKWCNARSQMAGWTPCYTVSGSTYKTGQSSPDCDLDAGGYRLPTSDEWEYAARGGLSGRRFPWGDTINHSRANYRANGSACSYDTSSYTTYTYHPSYDDGGYPYTSPAGSFSANGYGLYDMAGNVWEWCNTASGSYRHVLGGGWYGHAGNARCGYAYRRYPDLVDDFIGFRSVCR